MRRGKVEQQPSYDELRQYYAQLLERSQQRERQIEQFMLNVRVFRTQERLINLLVGAIVGIVAFKAWCGL